MPIGCMMVRYGVYFGIFENEGLVSSDTYTKARRPSEKRLMTLILTFADEGSRRDTPPQWVLESQMREADIGSGD
jgi:hypothetical protein